MTWVKEITCNGPAGGLGKCCPEEIRTVTRQADVAIVGDGVMGSSIAYFLTADPATTAAQNASGNGQANRTVSRQISMPRSNNRTSTCRSDSG